MQVHRAISDMTRMRLMVDTFHTVIASKPQITVYVQRCKQQHRYEYRQQYPCSYMSFLQLYHISAVKI